MRKILFLMCTLLTCTLTMMAQVTTSSIYGKVVADKETVIGATVTAKHVPSGTSYYAVTNQNGRYTIQGMRPGGPYEITISTSLLEVPNLITPDSPSGSNQVFKVKYQSLRTFEMWVYNRWGQELFHTTDPSEGWDGKHNGSTVPTGAYYYVIKAVGTDDQKYSKKGAINVLKTKNSGNH